MGLSTRLVVLGSLLPDCRDRQPVLLTWTMQCQLGTRHSGRFYGGRRQRALAAHHDEPQQRQKSCNTWGTKQIATCRVPKSQYSSSSQVSMSALDASLEADTMLLPADVTVPAPLLPPLPEDVLCTPMLLLPPLLPAAVRCSACLAATPSAAAARWRAMTLAAGEPAAVGEAV
jgi:hypothetical protein